MELRARLRYARLKVVSHFPKKGEVILKPYGSEEMLSLPEAVLEVESNFEFRPPDSGLMFDFEQDGHHYKVHEIHRLVAGIRDEGYVYYIPSSFKLDGIYYLIPAREYYNGRIKEMLHLKDIYGIVKELSLNDINSIPGILIRQLEAEYIGNSSPVIGRTIEGPEIDGPVTAGIYTDKKGQTQFISPDKLLDPTMLDETFANITLLVSFLFNDVDVVIYARHLTLYVKKWAMRKNGRIYNTNIKTISFETNSGKIIYLDRDRISGVRKVDGWIIKGAKWPSPTLEIFFEGIPSYPIGYFRDIVARDVALSMILSQDKVHLPYKVFFCPIDLSYSEIAKKIGNPFPEIISQKEVFLKENNLNFVDVWNITCNTKLTGIALKELKKGNLPPEVDKNTFTVDCLFFFGKMDSKLLQKMKKNEINPISLWNYIVGSLNGMRSSQSSPSEKAKRNIGS